MNAAALVQLAISGVAVALMVGLAAWATRGRGPGPLDERFARGWLADEFPDQELECLWLTADGQGAVAKSGDVAFVLFRLGDGYVARGVPWAQAAAASLNDGTVRIPFGDVAAPKAVLALDVWPPKELAA